MCTDDRHQVIHTTILTLLALIATADGRLVCRTPLAMTSAVAVTTIASLFGSLVLRSGSFVLSVTDVIL